MGIRISELPEAVSIQPTDVIVISDTETRKITYANLLEQLKSEIGGGGGGGGGTTRIITRQWRGLQIRIVADDIRATVGITGHTNASIAAKETWTTVGNFASDGITPLFEYMEYQVVNAVNTLRFSWAPDGTFKLGWGRVTASGASANIGNGSVVDMLFTIPLV